ASRELRAERRARAAAPHSARVRGDARCARRGGARPRGALPVRAHRRPRRARIDGNPDSRGVRRRRRRHRLVRDRDRGADAHRLFRRDHGGGAHVNAGVKTPALSGETEIAHGIVPTGALGYEISGPMHKLGWHASDTRELAFKDCAVPEGNLLGPRGRGFTQFMEILDGGRISVAAMGVGLAQGAYDLAFAYAAEREQFGRPISKFQAVQFALADMATEIEAGRQLVYRAAWLKDQGKPFALAAAQAKLYTGLLSNRAVNASLQIHGGYGFTEEYAISRL